MSDLTIEHIISTALVRAIRTKWKEYGMHLRASENPNTAAFLSWLESVMDLSSDVIDREAKCD